MENAIFSLIPENRIKDIMQTLHLYTGLCIKLIDLDGNTLLEFGKKVKYCAAVNERIIDKRQCKKQYVDAGVNAKSIGESYIFTCSGELSHIAFPFVLQGQLFGCAIIGPFIMGTLDSTIVGALIERYTVTPSLALSLNDSLCEIPIIPPVKVGYLKTLADYLLLPLISSEYTRLLQTQQKAYQQMLVNESIQEYKFEKKNTGAIDFYKNESELLQTMREGDIGSLKNYVSKIIADTYRADGNPESIRMHASSVLAAAALEAVKNGADAEIVYKLQKHYYDMITNESSVDEITYLLWEALDSIFNEIMVVADSGNPYIRNALKYMSKNYSTPLTLTEVADVVGLSPNYFSALFSKSVGMSFREKLCRIRIEESKRLLLSTDYSLTDIAVSLGFNDQSYFCKVFKKITGLTPIQFRFRG